MENILQSSGRWLVFFFNREFWKKGQNGDSKHSFLAEIIIYKFSMHFAQDLDDATVRENFFLDGVGLPNADSKAGSNSFVHMRPIV